MALTVGLTIITQADDPPQAGPLPSTGIGADDVLDIAPTIPDSPEKNEVNQLAHAYKYNPAVFDELRDQHHQNGLAHFEVLRTAYDDLAITDPSNFNGRWFYLALMGRLLIIDQSGAVIDFYESVARSPIPDFDESTATEEGDDGHGGAHMLTQHEMEAMVRIAASQAIVYFSETYDGEVPLTVRHLAIDALTRIAADPAAPEESVSVVIATFLEHEVAKDDILALLPDERGRFADYKIYEPNRDFVGPYISEEAE